MLYLCRRIHKSGPFVTNDFIAFWEELALRIEKIDESTWKIWDITQVFHKDNSQTQVYSMGEEWEPLQVVAKASPCYLHTEQDGHRTIFTLIAGEEEALTNVQTFIENSCAPVEFNNLDQILQRYKPFQVQTMKTYQKENGYQEVRIFDRPIMLDIDPFLDLRSSTKLLSLSAIVNIDKPLHVPVLHLNTTTHQLGFSVDPDSQNEPQLIKDLFILADRAFKGDSLWHREDEGWYRQDKRHFFGES